ncbi:MAG: alkaline phosphatase [Bacteroidaceae bacterium]|nr:alkaline phosphatase [Bacteroidaceae bacterium]
MKRILILLALTLMIGGVQAKKDIARHVIIIGIDGWGSYTMNEGAQVPHIRSYMSEGCYTLEKRASRPSISGCNWAAMMNGTPADGTGIVGNEHDPVFKPLTTTEHGSQPTFFYLMRKKHPDAELGIVCEWDGFQYYADTLSLSYNKCIDNPVQHPDDIVRETVKYIQEKKPAICFIHIDAPDHAGHAYGRGTPEYYACLEHVDTQIAQIVDGVKAAGIYDDTIFILTSDHGHNGKSHGGDSTDEIETPLVIWGKGIKKGHHIDEAVYQYDVAATVAKIFRLTPPSTWRGIPLDVFK